MSDLEAYFQLVYEELTKSYCPLRASNICAACLHKSIVSFAKPQSLQRNLALRTVIVLKQSSMNIAVSTSSYIVATSFRYAVTQVKMCSARTSEAKMLAENSLNGVDLFFVDDIRVYVGVMRKPVSYSMIRLGSGNVYWRPHTRSRRLQCYRSEKVVLRASACACARLCARLLLGIVSGFRGAENIITHRTTRMLIYP